MTSLKIGDAGHAVKREMLLWDWFMEVGFDLLAHEVVFMRNGGRLIRAFFLGKHLRLEIRKFARRITKLNLCQVQSR